VQKYFEDYKLPADIRRFASSTTLKVNLKKIRKIYIRERNVYIWDDAQVLHGGMRLPIEIEEKEIDISKETLEEEQYMLYGKDFDSLVLETYYESQLPENIYQKYLRLDNTLPYVSTCIYNYTYFICIKIYIL